MFNLLDCTLRDGGYINEWNFGEKTIGSILNKLVESRVNYVEVGFLRNCEYDSNKTLFNNCKEIQKILPKKNKNTVFTVMALHNMYDINKLEDYDGKTIEVIRVTFHDYDIDEGLSFIEKAIDKGYKVFCNHIDIMGYSDEQIISLINHVNKIKPYAFSIVDTFGSMMKQDLIRIYSIVEHNLDENISIGLHLHENLSMSFSLAQTFIEISNPKRNYIIDASLQGMGRVPGNLCMELIMEYMNRYKGENYNVNSVLDAIDEHIIKMKNIEPWGYSIAYALSAKYNLHRNYAEYLVEKGNLRAKQINHILSNVENDKKTVFDKDYIEKLYIQYQSIKVDDSKIINNLKMKLDGREIMILAPGISIRKYNEKINNYILKNNPIVIAANFDGDMYKVNQYFFSNAKRFEEFIMKVDMNQCIITSNLKHISHNCENVLNYYDLAFSEKGIQDNCVIMLIQFMISIGIKKLNIAGFDGYYDSGDNYIDSYLTSNHIDMLKENNRNKQYISWCEKEINLNFLTPSLYKE